ncbi:hypothetical protein HanXRQr2_Chr04g0182131 [Helianthus annuus]|uniref:Uncharacterized protein n=1 Tax=Helianthus annuus TaxID=4232 RepID=A0A9K3JAV6_HELAN|nr:hypothetical protein HanXRQr2_Chr04g0182131 [Helianthus annuus]KAJ0932609.1 hypothetical protein HanPSC8_Chr04g0175601 [Helianthus annuus]
MTYFCCSFRIFNLCCLDDKAWYSLRLIILILFLLPFYWNV